MSDPAEDYSGYAADAAIDPDEKRDLLRQISDLTRDLMVATNDVTLAQIALKAAQDRENRIAERELPELMDRAGQRLLVTTDGIKVELTEKLRTSISAVNEAAAFKWLEEHGLGSIVKRVLSLRFDKGQEEKAKEAKEAMEQAGFQPEIGRTVHPGTLQKVLRESLAEGVDVPLQTFGAFHQRRAAVSASKG